MYLTLRNLYSIIFFILFLNLTKAQTTGKFIKASIGIGYTYSDYDEKYNESIDGSGFYAQGEYVVGLTSWFSVRPYAGLILTSTNQDSQNNPQNYKVTSKAFLLGGKARICAPIPWVAPYIESGIGTSVGSFETYTPINNIKKDGFLVHVPFTIGLAVGRKNNIDIEFTYYFHSSADQFSGAFAGGFSFPLD